MIFNDRVEVRLDDSKMSNTAEFMTLARGTRGSNLDAGQMLLDLAKECGRKVKDATPQQAAAAGGAYLSTWTTRW